MPTGRVFDGIRNLDVGDVFALHTLDDVYAYRVTSWEIIDPDNYEIDMQQASDTVTLVTCTTTPDAFNPKGALYINDKRLLVHAERCVYDESEFASTPVDTVAYVNDNTLPALIVAGILFIMFVTTLTRKIMRKKKRASQRG